METIVAKVIKDSLCPADPVCSCDVQTLFNPFRILCLVKIASLLGSVLVIYSFLINDMLFWVFTFLLKCSYKILANFQLNLFLCLFRDISEPILENFFAFSSTVD